MDSIFSGRLHKIRAVVFAAATVFGTGLGSVSGQVISNIGNTSGTQTIGLDIDQIYAFSFTTGSSVGGYDLTDVKLKLYSLNGDNPLNVGIYTDASTHPDPTSGIVLQEQSHGQGYGIAVTYLPTSTLLLAPNTTYWIGLTGALQTEGFFTTTDTSYSSSLGWTFNSSTTSYGFTGDHSNITTSTSPKFWQTGSYTTNLTIDAEAAPILMTVPEPSIAWLFAVGLGALIVRRRLTKTI